MGTEQEIGQEIRRFGSVTSTMDVAWEASQDGAVHGTTIIAGTQTRGRGRFARRWVSGEGQSLLLSVILDPSPSVAPLLPVVAALAVADAAKDTAGLDCDFKWPNDVFFDNKKLAGILLEGHAEVGGGIRVVLGIGVNVSLRLGDHEELAGKALSLSEAAGRAIATGDLEEAVIRSLRVRYGQAAAQPNRLIRDWASGLTTLGQDITVHQRDGSLEGRADDIDESGRLILILRSGERRVVSEGDVTLSG
jgi:BirA family biotin operon repressor/biotin-[acetyl-CoA-carboxylase] ligase